MKILISLLVVLAVSALVFVAGSSTPVPSFAVYTPRVPADLTQLDCSVRMLESMYPTKPEDRYRYRVSAWVLRNIA